jgi:hypothetical protein
MACPGFGLLDWRWDPSLRRLRLFYGAGLVEAEIWMRTKLCHRDLHQTLIRRVASGLLVQIGNRALGNASYLRPMRAYRLIVGLAGPLSDWSSVLPRFNDGALALSRHSELEQSDIEICCNMNAIPTAPRMG